MPPNGQRALSVTGCGRLWKAMSELGRRIRAGAIRLAYRPAAILGSFMQKFRPKERLVVASMSFTKEAK